MAEPSFTMTEIPVFTSYSEKLLSLYYTIFPISTVKLEGGIIKVGPKVFEVAYKLF